MRITQEADYAIRLCSALAREDRPIGAPHLSEALCIPQRSTSKILRMLTRAGIVGAARGAVGGFFLTMAPETVSLLMIIEAIDGPIAIRHCLSPEHTCSYRSNKTECRFHKIFEELNRLIRSRLDMLTIEDITDSELPVSGLLEKLYNFK